MIFYLALTYGLASNPKAAFEKVIRKLEELQKKAGFEAGINLSCSVSDGKKLYTIRYGSKGIAVKSQFYSTDMNCIEDMGTDDDTAIPQGGVIVVSEPLDRQSDKWIQVPANSFLEIELGKVLVHPLAI